jgi:hypothetical protein
MNYYCTAAAVPIMNALTPEDIEDLLNDYGYPDGGILITDGYESTCIASQTDFKPTSRLIEFEDFYTSIEYFENGIPEWLEPKPGIVIFSALWTGKQWEYTKMEFSNG